jgi:putative tryptophan/tyrosine transport system substrate-binding protein
MQEATMHRCPLGVLVALALALLVAPLAADAQPPAGKVHRIGRLIAGAPPVGPDPPLEAFQQGLRDLGYVEAQNIRIESRYAEGQEGSRCIKSSVIPRAFSEIVGSFVAQFSLGRKDAED